MGSIMSYLTEKIELFFSDSIQFDSCYNCENPTENPIILSGEQTIKITCNTNTSCEIVVAKNAKIELLTTVAPNVCCSLHIICESQSQCNHLIVQTTTASQQITVQQKDNSLYDAKYFLLDGESNNIEVSVAKDGEFATTNMSGVLFPTNTESYSITTNIQHNKPNCETYELFRCIVDDSAKSSFSGLIYVAKDAQKTAAQQQNKNLLLSKDAHIHSEPQLEIYADDVVCNHGSSTGQIDEEALWYMQTRGISKEKALKLLVSGFANDVLQQLVNENLKTAIEDCISYKLQH